MKEQLKGMFGLVIGSSLAGAAFQGISNMTGSAKNIAETGVSLGVLGFGASMANKMFKW